MKKCQKHSEPSTLQTYSVAQPQGTWDDMQSDALHSGQQAYRDIKQTLVKCQRGLCAYCEIRITDGLSNETIKAKNYWQRIEHFHPKSDRTGAVNWALHWPNLWAVCQGGSQFPGDNVSFDPNQYLPPLPANLSCDAFKDHQINAGRLPALPEGWILAPDEILAFPLLFQFAPNGTPEPHTQNCTNLVLPNNNYVDTVTLVAETIKHLNLGCMRLNRSRCIAKAQLEKQIKKARQQAPGVAPQTVLLNLARRLFSNNAASAWPQFFTLLRWRLGNSAEQHLQAILFQG